MHKALHTVARTFRASMDIAPIQPIMTDCRRMLAAYSGGADSAALLVLLSTYCAEKKIPLVAVHVHHGIRGEEADRDAAFCADFCAARGIDFRLERVDAPAYSETHAVGLEEAARTLRYEVLDRIAAGEEGTRIATAHSADDNLETVLFRLARGTALDGLCGIPPVRENIIRPLLACTAEDIRDYCHAEDIPFVTDSTNTDTTYTRNFIRREIVPLMRQIAAEPAVSVSRMSESLRADAAYLREMAEDVLRQTSKETFISLDRLHPLPDALLSRCIVILYENAAGGRRDLSAQHIHDVMRAVRAGGFSRVSLPGEITAVIAGRLLTMEKGKAEIPEPDPDFEVPLMLGDNLFPHYGFGVRMERVWKEKIPEIEEDCQNIYKLSTRAAIPFDTIKGTVLVRFRRGGDSIRTGGMTRVVKKMLNEAKIPPAERARLPVFCDDGGVLWVPGLPYRDGKLSSRAPSAEGYVFFTYFLL